MKKHIIFILCITSCITLLFAENDKKTNTEQNDTIHRELPLEIIKQGGILPEGVWQTEGLFYSYNRITFGDGNLRIWEDKFGSHLNFLPRYSFTKRLEFPFFPLPFFNFRVSKFDICDSLGNLTQKPSVVIGGGVSRISWTYINNDESFSLGEIPLAFVINVKVKQAISEKFWYYSSLLGEYHAQENTFSLGFAGGFGRQTSTHYAATIGLTLNYHEEDGLPVYTGELPLNLIHNINKSLGFGFFIEPRIDFRHYTEETFSIENFGFSLPTGFSLTCQW